MEAGIRAIEVTLDSPGALASIGALRSRFDAGLIVGAGTVRSVQGVVAADDAGAEFIVTPNVDEAVLATSRVRGLPSLAGALTPTEALHAWDCGASAVKLFPAGPFGPGYLKALRDPLHDIPFIPTGGVTATGAGAWLAEGAAALGVGGWVLAGGLDRGTVLSRTQALVSAVREP